MVAQLARAGGCPPELWLNNLSALATSPFVGGLIVRALIGDVHDPHNLARHKA